jgi:phospholipid/cholesterol/gamma-HCH transport system substrate-binding protein
LKYRVMDQMVGAFLVLTAVLLVAALILIGRGNAWFRRYEPYHAVFKEGYGLQPGSKVKMLDIAVGKVTAVRIEPSNHVRVDLKVFREYASRIREDSRLTVEGASILGGSHLSLKPGAESAPELPRGAQIASDDKHSIDDYLEYLKSLDLESKFETVVSIATNVEALTAGLNDPEGPLWTSLNHLESLLRGLEEGRGTAGRLLKEEDLYVRLEQRVAQTRAILSDFSEISGRMVGVSAQVETLIARLDQVVGQASQLLVSLQETGEELPGLTREVQRTLRDISPVLDVARRTLEDADATVESLRNNPVVLMGGTKEEERKPIQMQPRGGGR